MSAIKRHTDDPVAKHFNTHKEKGDCLRIVGLEHIKNNNIHYRKIRESFWIKKLGTLWPEGLNQNLGIGDGDRSLLS